MLFNQKLAPGIPRDTADRTSHDQPIDLRPDDFSAS
jgi:hypothetical protein